MTASVTEEKQAHENCIQFQILGRPVPAARIATKGQKKKKRLTFQSQRYLEYKRQVALTASKHIAEPFEGPVKVTLLICARPGKQGDWDNYAKSICDAMNGISYRDDNQIVDGRVIRCQVDEPGKERAEVLIETVKEGHYESKGERAE